MQGYLKDRAQRAFALSYSIHAESCMRSGDYQNAIDGFKILRKEVPIRIMHPADLGSEARNTKIILLRA